MHPHLSLLLPWLSRSLDVPPGDLSLRVDPERSDWSLTLLQWKKGVEDFGLKHREGGGFSMTRCLSHWAVYIRNVHQEAKGLSTSPPGSVFTHTYMGVCS